MTATRSASVGDDGEVVADVERRDAVRVAEVAHGAQHVRLRRHVEAGGRLVEHDHARPAREGHREADALLLAARELVRVAAQELVGRRAAQPRRASRRAARPARVVVADAPKPCTSRVSSWSDAQDGVQRRARDPAARRRRSRRAARAAVGRASEQDLVAVDRDARRAPIRAPRRVCPSSARPTVDLPEPDSPTSPSTSPARIANEISSTMSTPRRRDLDAQVLDDDRNCRARSSSFAAVDAGDRRARARRRSGWSRSSGARSRSPAARRPTAARSDPVPVLVDHQAPVGGRRLQAEAEEAEAGDQADRVGAAQLDLDQQRAGDVRQDLAEQDAPRDSPIACVARTKSRSTISSAEPRVTRATRGTVVTPTRSRSATGSGRRSRRRRA